ncbi:MAG TPA: tetratricopeptide repeat protein [Streptosporangiaceae bacterium]|nr:tetratricopeptide repeat protein [Streptosporangiaceae bacterium]
MSEADNSPPAGEVARSGVNGAAPYVGPRPFRQSDAGRFFGRDPEARDVLSAWRADRVTVLHGPHAVGKTSLLRAGVLPRVSRQSDVDLLPIGSLGYQAARPPAAAPPHNSYSFALLGQWAQLGSPPRPGTAIAKFLLDRAKPSSDEDEPRSVLAAIDQFEVLFSGFPSREAEREGLFADLKLALEAVPALKLLLVISDDHLATLRRYESRFAPLKFSYMSLAALGPDAAVEAVKQPLDGRGRFFGDGVAEDLVERLRTVQYTDVMGESTAILNELVEPLLLQIVCSELWSSLPSAVRAITSGDLQAAGDLEQALIRFYEHAIRSTATETGESEGALRSWVEGAFITEQGARGTACKGVLRTGGMRNEVAEAFEQCRLLSAEYRALSTWYQLSQDRMTSAVINSNRVWRTANGIDTGPGPAPATPAALIAAAEAALAEGNFAAARRFANSAAENHRKAGDSLRLAHALVLLGGIAKTEGDLVGAKENLDSALSIFSQLEDKRSIVQTLTAIADLHFWSGDYETAAALQREAIERSPTSVAARVGLGYALWYSGSPSAAAASFEQALTWDARSAAAFGGRGQVRAELREFGDALKDLDDALTLGLAPNEEIDARSARALALVGLGRGEEADRELAMARIQDPDRGRTLRRLARIAQMRDQRALAVEEAKRALSARPPLPPWDTEDAQHLVATLAPGSQPEQG